MTNEETFETVVALLEVTASGNPRLIDFQLRTILNSPSRRAVYALASAYDVAHQEVGQTVYRACVDLDRLERRRGAERDPVKTLGSPNLPALLDVCRARVKRVRKLARQRRLESILRGVEQAYRLARSRAWIDAFIGEPLAKKRREAQEAER